MWPTVAQNMVVASENTGTWLKRVLIGCSTGVVYGLGTKSATTSTMRFGCLVVV